MLVVHITLPCRSNITLLNRINNVNRVLIAMNRFLFGHIYLAFFHVSTNIYRHMVVYALVVYISLVLKAA